MLPFFLKSKSKKSIPIWLVKKGNLDFWLTNSSKLIKQWVFENSFKETIGNFLLVPNLNGKLEGVILITGKNLSLWTLAGLPEKLPKKDYYIASNFNSHLSTKLCIGWGLGTYKFTKYIKDRQKSEFASLVIPTNANWLHAQRTIAATFFVRDLVNMPAMDMTPRDLEEVAKVFSDMHGSRLVIIKGKDLKNNFPGIYHVGKAGEEEPRLIDLKWGRESAPKVTLLGKGVCFDSGGLNLKTSTGMTKMKKDMGGAAMVLGLAHMIMDAKLDIRLRLLIPAVENSIDKNSYHPGDVLTTRSGKTVEIGNTDAEGRIILADSLSFATEENVDLLIDIATLTGAARVALGPDLPALFTQKDNTFKDIENQTLNQEDALWRLPLWETYKRYISSNIADLNNSGSSSFAGAITAALFLKEFVPSQVDWVHIDSYCWNDRNRVGRPIGGEAIAIRTLFSFLQKRYC